VLQVSVKTLKKALGYIRERYAFPLRPVKQMLRRSDARAGGCLYIARLVEFFGKAFKQRGLRSFAEFLNSLRAPENMFQHDVLLLKLE
jgi:hypothetical protein